VSAEPRRAPRPASARRAAPVRARGPLRRQRRRLPRSMRLRPLPPTATRSCPMLPSRTARPRLRPAPRRAGCRRFRRRPCRSRVQVRPGRRARVHRGFPARRGLPLPRQTSGDQAAPARLVRRVLRPRGPVRLAALLASARPSGRAVKAAGPTSKARDLPPGRVPRAPRALARPALVHRVLPVPGPGPAARVLARGQAITRSARPRPAWGQRLRPGRRRLVRPLPARLPVPVARVRLDAALAVQVVPAARVPVVLVVPAARVLVVPGRAR
jgi:hypothetical protein